MKIKLKSIPISRVYETTDMDNLFQGNADSLKVMNDIFTIVKDVIPAGEVDNLMKIEASKPVDFVIPFQNAMRFLRSDSTGYNLCKDDKGRGFVKIYQYYNINEWTIYSLGLNFLPDLKKKSKHAYDAMIHTLAELSRFGLSVLDHSSMHMEWLAETLCEDYENMDDSDSDNEWLKQNMQFHQKHLNAIIEDVNKASGDDYDIDFNIMNYNWIGKFEKIVIEWCRKAIKLCRSNRNLRYYEGLAYDNYVQMYSEDGTDENLFEDGLPVEISDYMFISSHDPGYVHSMLGQALGEQASEFGSIQFVCPFECYFSSELNTTKEVMIEQHGRVPEEMAELLSEGYDMYHDICKMLKIKTWNNNE